MLTALSTTLELALERSKLIGLLFDVEGKPIYQNEMARGVTGLLTVAAPRVAPGKGQAGAECPLLTQLRSTRQSVRRELTVVQGGSTRRLELDYSPVFDRAGDLVCICAIGMDMTVRCDAEAALRAADGQKNQFLALLSHELRGPLAPLRSCWMTARMRAGVRICNSWTGRSGVWPDCSTTCWMSPGS